MMLSRREILDRAWRMAVAVGAGLLIGEISDPPFADAAIVTRYINKDLTTGSNNGTSPA